MRKILSVLVGFLLVGCATSTFNHSNYPGAKFTLVGNDTVLSSYTITKPFGAGGNASLCIARYLSFQGKGSPIKYVSKDDKEIVATGYVSHANRSLIAALNGETQALISYVLTSKQISNDTVVLDFSKIVKETKKGVEQITTADHPNLVLDELNLVASNIVNCL